MNQKPNNDFGFMIFWAYLMVLSIVLAPVIAYAIKQAIQ